MILGLMASGVLAEAPAFADETKCEEPTAKTPTLTESKEVNDLIHEFWTIQDDSAYRAPFSNIAAGVFVAPAFFRDSNDVLRSRLLAGPAVFFRLNLFNRMNSLPAQALQRAYARLDRLIEHVYPDLETKFQQELTNVAAQRTHLAELRDAVRHGGEQERTPERIVYEAHFLEDLGRQDHELVERESAACEARWQTYFWSRQMYELMETLPVRPKAGHPAQVTTRVAITGIEFALGFAFDPFTNPSHNKVYSGAAGGAGVTFLVFGLGVGIGTLAEEDALVGGYLSISAPILN